MNDMRVIEVTIETFTNARIYLLHAYRHDLPTFLINSHPIRYYAFETVEGIEERFLYSDIRHISFRDLS